MTNNKNNMNFKEISTNQWQSSKDVVCIQTIDTHTAGEPLRIILNGFPNLRGKSVLEQRKYAYKYHDNIRRALMWEPRGHADMYGCLVNPSVTDEADFSVLFMHNEGFSTMCGHGIIGVTTAMLECGIMPMKSPETTVKIDTPAGLVTAIARTNGKKVNSVYFYNVPSFVFSSDQILEISEFGQIKYDIAFGGAFYAFVNADDLGLKMIPENSRQLISVGMTIKNAIIREVPIIHPLEKEMNFLYGTIFTGKPISQTADSRNVCIFAEGEVDRSPTGTGVSARLALHYANGEISIGDSMVIESIIGSQFRGSVKENIKFGVIDSIIPEVEGNAFITGRHEFYIDSNDPLKHGFIIR